MDWPELLDHPIWTQVLKEEEDVKEEEEDEEGHQEEKNSCEEVGSASSRCVDILLFLYSSCSIRFVPALLLHTAFLCSNVHINGRCVAKAQSSLL